MLCASPFRVCRICITQGAVHGLVLNPITGLCRFHTENGEQAKPQKEVTERPLPSISATTGNRHFPIAPIAAPPKSTSTHAGTVAPTAPRVLIESFPKHGTVRKVPEYLTLADKITHLRDVDGLSSQTISTRMGINPSAIAALYGLRRLVPALRKFIEHPPEDGRRLIKTAALRASKMEPDDQLEWARHYLAGLVTATEFKP